MSRGLAFATKPYAHDHVRLRALLGPLGHEFAFFAFDSDKKFASAARLLRTIHRDRPEVVVMEGTSVAGDIPILLARLVLKTRYVVGGGDAVGAFLAVHTRGLGPLAWVYEFLLMRFSAGFIGWTPYLVGRALTLGAPRAITAPSWAAHDASPDARRAVREQLGISEDAIVFGLAGSLNWVARVGYAYGAELISAVKRTSRADVVVLIVGGGSGLAYLEELAGNELGGRVRLVGRVPREAVPDYLRAFDIASLPQSCDQVGAFRYTTKLPEYLAAELPIVTGQLPVAYDLMLKSSWILPGSAPWSERYIDALAQLMATVSAADIAARRPDSAGDVTRLFTLDLQQERVESFIRDLMSRT